MKWNPAACRFVLGAAYAVHSQEWLCYRAPPSQAPPVWLIPFGQWRFLQVGRDTDYGVDERGGHSDAKRGAHARLQIEMLRIDSDRGKSGEHSTRSSANCSGN